METLPAQFITHIGFTARKLHCAHPPKKDLFSYHYFLAVVYSRLGAMTEVSAKSVCSALEEKDQISTTIWWK